jgi:histidinol dehydrogenase
MIVWSQCNDKDKAVILARPQQCHSVDVRERTQQILADVAENGDQAVRSWTQQLDGHTTNNFRLPTKVRDALAAQLDAPAKNALQEAFNAIYRFHAAQRPEHWSLTTRPGVTCEWRFAPIEQVGLYIPGGSASLPSTVLMLTIPAIIAGCRRIVMVTPPNRSEALVSPAIAFAAQLCGIEEIYNIGGAQAIAALAFGTASVERVDKIFGPGNAYVTEAKRQVAARGICAIDMLAGPSELMVIADNQANAQVVAADLLSQAEHGPDSQVILVSTSEALIKATRAAIDHQLTTLLRQHIAQKALAHMRVILVDSIDDACDICQQYAPEHLIINTRSPRRWLDRITNAGSVFLGAWSPETAGDYASGTNHCLPTYGTCRTQSALGVEDFGKRFAVQELTQEGLTQLAPILLKLAEIEQLDAHANAVSIRMSED